MYHYNSVIKLTFITVRTLIISQIKISRVGISDVKFGLRTFVTPTFIDMTW